MVSSSIDTFSQINAVIYFQLFTWLLQCSSLAFVQLVKEKTHRYNQSTIHKASPSSTEGNLQLALNFLNGQLNKKYKYLSAYHYAAYFHFTFIFYYSSAVGISKWKLGHFIKHSNIFTSMRFIGSLITSDHQQACRLLTFSKLSRKIMRLYHCYKKTYTKKKLRQQTIRFNKLSTFKKMNYVFNNNNELRDCDGK